MASQSADIGSELLILNAELPTLATAMKSAPPTGEGIGEWEYGSKDRRCMKSSSKMLFMVLWDAYTLLNNKYLTRWFRGWVRLADQNICDIFDYLVPSLFIYSICEEINTLTHLLLPLGQMLTVLTENVLKLCQKYAVFLLLSFQQLEPAAISLDFTSADDYQESNMRIVPCRVESFNKRRSPQENKTHTHTRIMQHTDK